MQYFPRSAQLFYSFDLFTKSGASHSLLTLVLSSGHSVVGLTRDLQQVISNKRSKYQVLCAARECRRQGSTGAGYEM